MPPPVPKVRLQWPQCFSLSETFLMVWVTLKWVECSASWKSRMSWTPVGSSFLLIRRAERGPVIWLSHCPSQRSG